jgi:hypothetical protein
MDTTGNYHANWLAYSKERKIIPDSEHGMNWANVWKRLIPQLILKGSIAATSKLCKQGHYFVVPDQVYQRFERLIGDVPVGSTPGEECSNCDDVYLGATGLLWHNSFA